MFDFKQILVPVDFSEVSLEAVKAALQVGWRHGARVHLIFPEPSLDKELKKRLTSAPLGTYVEDSIQAEENALRKAADNAKADLRDAGRNVDEVEVVPAVVVQQFPSSAIEYVLEHHIDLVVIGTHGRKGLKGALFGTDTETIIDEVPCAVFVVKPEGYPLLRGEDLAI